MGDRPPVLDDAEAQVLFWLRAFPRQGVPEIGRLRWVGVNAAEVEQVADAVPEFLGLGNGLPHQELRLANSSIRAESVHVEVEEHTTWRRWEIVDSFAASGPDDRHLVLDAAAGVLRGGDTVRGRTFGIGDRIRALGYRYGGGARGNVEAGAVSTVSVPGVEVANPVALAGGEEAETISRALERVPGELSRHDRAVTAGDFEELARLPGVGRAECLPRFLPRDRQWEVPGVVSVVVWPTSDPLHPEAPVPSASLIRAVCQHLDRRRLVTTELYVIPPTYRRVAVSVGIQVEPGHSAIGVRRWVELVLRQYLAALPPYGPDGGGWPLGHRVHGPELEAAVLQVEGVDFLDGLEVGEVVDVVDEVDGLEQVVGTEVVPGTVELEGWEVVELAEVTVVVGPPPPPGTSITPPPGPAPVPVPVPREEC